MRTFGKFQIDKKSITKCVLALQKYHICRIHKGDYEVDGVTYEVCELFRVYSIAL